MKCSIVMATKNKVDYLQKVLASIFRQKVPFSYEVIVVDDGSTDTTSEVCKNFDVQYIRLENSSYRNPSIASRMK
jgi:glycosyltransferase involved in cell wall biosynthesis